MITKIKTNNKIREYSISGSLPEIMNYYFDTPIDMLNAARQICLIEYRGSLRAELYDAEDGFMSASVIFITEEIWSNWISAGLEVTPL